MMRTLVVEDELNNAKLICHFLEKYCPNVELLGVAESVQEAKVKINQLKPDLLLLDIMLEDGTGFDLLNTIGANKLKVIFTTAYSDFAIKAFRYSAVDYLMKPIEIDELVEAINKAEDVGKVAKIDEQMQLLYQNLNGQTKKDKFIAIPMHDRIEFVEIQSIVYVQADRKYSTFVTRGGESHISSKNLGEYEKVLADHDFIRTHKSCLVNLNEVKRIHRKDGLYCEMKNGEMMPIARRAKDELMKRLMLR